MKDIELKIELTCLVAFKGIEYRVLEKDHPDFKWGECRQIDLGDYATIDEAESALQEITKADILNIIREDNRRSQRYPNIPYNEDLYIVGYIIYGPLASDALLSSDTFYDENEDDEDDEDDEVNIFGESPLYQISYSADKKIIARYDFGNHYPGKENYRNIAPFKPGDIVWACNATRESGEIIPAEIVRPFDLGYLIYKKWDFLRTQKEPADRRLYEMYIPTDTSDLGDNLYDQDWDAIIVKPLIKVKGFDGCYLDTDEYESFSRLMLFPYNLPIPKNYKQ